MLHSQCPHSQAAAGRGRGGRRDSSYAGNVEVVEEYEEEEGSAKWGDRDEDPDERDEDGSEDWGADEPYAEDPIEFHPSLYS